MSILQYCQRYHNFVNDVYNVFIKVFYNIVKFTFAQNFVWTYPPEKLYMCVWVKIFQFRHKNWDELTTARIEFLKTVNYLATL